MKSRFLLCAYLCALVSPAWAQSVYPQDFKVAKAFQEALKYNQRAKVAALVQYPLHRDYPLPSIANKGEFLAHWDEFFDRELVARLTNAPPAEMGWRGVMLKDGCVWFNEGKAVTFNCNTPAYGKAWKAARQSEPLYQTARGYDRLYLECSTNSVHVRTQLRGKDLQYFAWKKGASLTTKPQLELHGGVEEMQGSGGNYNLHFSNSPYRYVLEVEELCDKDCHNDLVVYKGDQEISRRACLAPKSP